MSTDPFIDSFNDRQSTIMTLRRIQLSIGCAILGGIVATIIKSIKYFIYRKTLCLQYN